jgi:uncharacterized lipoprotein YmbA
MRSVLAALPMVAVLLLAGACLEPRPITLRYYTLSSEPPVAPVAREPMAALGLGPVTLPPYLDRSELVTRVSPERVTFSSDDRWAAPLSAQFSRALADELRARVPAREVVSWPWPRDLAPPLAVAVQVQKFEAGVDGAAVLEARWTVTPGAGGAPLAAGETRVREVPATRDAAGSVGALGRAVGALARDVAGAVSALPRR